jgi:hypothetical protein
MRYRIIQKGGLDNIKENFSTYKKLKNEEFLIKNPFFFYKKKMEEGLFTLLESNLSNNELEAGIRDYVDNEQPSRADVIALSATFTLRQAGVDTDNTQQSADAEWVLQVIAATIPLADAIVDSPIAVVAEAEEDEAEDMDIDRDEEDDMDDGGDDDDENVQDDSDENVQDDSDENVQDDSSGSSLLPSSSSVSTSDEEKESEPKPKIIFDAQSFLNNIKPLCTAVHNGAAAPALPLLPPNMDQTQQYIHTAKDNLNRCAIATPREDFCSLLSTGHLIETCHTIAKEQWSEIGASIGLKCKNIQGHSIVKRTRALYNLVVKHNMHKLRFLEPQSKRMTSRLISNAAFIIKFIEANPEEAAWWSNNGAPIPTVNLPDKNGVLVLWINLAWLL